MAQLKKNQHIHYKEVLKDGTELKVPGIVLNEEVQYIKGNEIIEIGVPDSYGIIAVFVHPSKIIEE